MVKSVVQCFFCLEFMKPSVSRADGQIFLKKGLLINLEIISLQPHFGEIVLL